MRCVIRPTRSFSAAEQKRLQGWLNALEARKPGAARMIDQRGTTLVVETDVSLATDLAVAVMLVIGRPFHFRVIQLPAGAPARITPAAKPRSTSAGRRGGSREFGWPASR